MSKTNLTADDYQEAIELNSEQEKAFKALERAVSKCRKANIYFYQVLQNLGGLNGDNVESVEEGGSLRAEACLQFLEYPRIRTVDSWADDTHYLVLKGEK